MNSKRSPRKSNVEEISNLVDNISDEMINAQQALMRMSFKMSDLERYLEDIDGDVPMINYEEVEDDQPDCADCMGAYSELIARMGKHIVELEEKIANLKSLVCDMWRSILLEYPQGGFPDIGVYEERMRNLGLEASE